MYILKLFPVFYLTSVLSSVAGARTPCLGLDEGNHINALSISKLVIEYNDPGVKFTWQAVRGTTNVTYWSNGIELQANENEMTDGGEVIEIKEIKKQRTSLATAVKAFPGVLFCCAVLFHCASDNRKTFLLFLIIGLASFAFCQIPSECPEKFLHVEIPTAHIKELCVNAACRSTLCPLSHDSEFSQIPSNNKILFSDENCTIRQPAFWDKWLLHYFGNNSGQDYFGDIDRDGLVNLLEYYGKCAFINNFRTIGGIQTSNASVSDICPPADFDSILEQGCDPTKADTDGDLLPDGQERLYNTDPNIPDSIDDDLDEDGLDSLMEVIQHTDPG